MRRFLTLSKVAAGLFASLGLAWSMGACSAGNDPEGTGGATSQGTGTQTGQGGGIASCPRCDFAVYVDCEGNSTDCEAQGLVCAPTLGCATCAPGSKTCIGNEVHECTDQGMPAGPVIETCDVDAGLTCHNVSARPPARSPKTSRRTSAANFGQSISISKTD